MYGHERTPIDQSHYELLAAHGEQMALITVQNLDVNAIGGVYSFHRYDDTYVLEQAYPGDEYNTASAHHELLDASGHPAGVVINYMERLIDDQQQSDSPQRFTWHLETGVDDVKSSEPLAELLETVVGPERLEPDFEVPDDEPVATLDISFEAVEIIREANNFRVGAPVTIEQHRGTTYIIGLTDEYARAIADAIHDLQMEYKDQGLYESAEVAERVEGQVLRAETTVAGEATA